MEPEHRHGRAGRLAHGSGLFARLSDERPAMPRGDELAQIVHDLKSPLSSIAREADTLEARGATCDGLDIRGSIDRIRYSVRHLDRLIYDLVDACTLSHGRLALTCEPCDLTAVVERVIERVVPCSERHRVFLAPCDSAEVLADELRIERVMMNLLDNALEYTPSSGGIVIRMAKDDRNVQISISDAGPGLAVTDLAAVFEPHRRASRSAGRAGGVGLYVSKQIVEAHGGSIGVESIRGLGARFFFALPLRRSS
ncbi:MAG TPA: HAMP domain-containing sensor histidine kinase [Kofleriaceae bacterium]|jgi:signal transduction histidine kinase